MKLLLCTLLILSFTFLYAGEICNNGIDDDGDGLIDLNDISECQCNPLLSVTSLIPNPSFEDTIGCPNNHSEIHLVTNWKNFTLSSTCDYYNLCGMTRIDIAGFSTNNPFPTPDGSGCAGFLDRNTNALGGIVKEYLGTCLSAPIQAGIDYRLDLNIFTAIDTFLNLQCRSTDLDLTLYGTTNCGSFPFQNTGSTCPPTLDPNWVELGTVKVNYLASSWQLVSINFTTTSNINAIVIGAGCNIVSNFDCSGWGTGPNDYANYYFIDNLVLSELMPNPVNILKSGVYCAENIILSAQSVLPISNPAYQWYKNGIAIVGETSSTYSVPAGPTGIGSYQVQITDNGNCNLSTILEITEEKLEFTVELTHATCFEKHNGQAIIHHVNGQIPINYFINNILVSDSVISNLSAGLHTITIEDSQGCSSQQQIVIHAPNALEVQSTSPLCLEHGNQILTATASGGTPPYNYLWDATVLSSNYNFLMSQDTIYTVQALDANNCLSNIFNIQVNEIPSIDFIANHQTGCPGLKSTFTPIVNGESNLNNVVSVVWDLGGGTTLSNELELTQEYKNTGIYDASLEILFDNGCRSSVFKSDYIKVYDYPKASFLTIPEHITTINPDAHFINQSENAVSFEWYIIKDIFSHQENPSYSFQQGSGSYEVCLKVNSAQECIDSTCQIISIKDDMPFYVPNSFTPDGDKLNDVFQVFYAGQAVEHFELLIYTRWGSLVKSFNNIKDQWDGTQNGIELPMGAYTWTILIKKEGQKIISQTGSVTLLR